MEGRLGEESDLTMCLLCIHPNPQKWGEEGWREGEKERHKTYLCAMSTRSSLTRSFLDHLSRT